jgi:hypothetical protein
LIDSERIEQVPDFITEPSFHNPDAVRSLSHFCDELLDDEGYHSVQSTFDSCESYEMPATHSECSNGYQTAHTPDPSTTHCSSVEGIPAPNEMAIAAAVQQLPKIFYTLKVLDQRVAMDKSSAGFTFHIPMGGGVKAADWGVS